MSKEYGVGIEPGIDVETAETKQTQWRTQQSMSDYLSGILRGLCIGQVLRE